MKYTNQRMSYIIHSFHEGAGSQWSIFRHFPEFKMESVSLMIEPEHFGGSKNPSIEEDFTYGVTVAQTNIKLRLGKFLYFLKWNFELKMACVLISFSIKLVRIQKQKVK